MTNGAAPASLRDEHLKALTTLQAVAAKYLARYEKHRLPPNHHDSKLPAIHCFEHDVHNYDIDPDSYADDREESWLSKSLKHTLRHWYKLENPAPRSRKRKFCRKQKKMYRFYCFDSSSSTQCVYDDPKRDIKVELSPEMEKTKKTCIFIEDGDLTVVQQPFLLRACFYVSIKNACERGDGDEADTFFGRMAEALSTWKIPPDLEIACGWHNEIFEYPKWDWKFLMRNLRHRAEEER